MTEKKKTGHDDSVGPRKRAEEALRQSHERYSQLANSITDVFFAFDKDLKYTYWNAASEKLTKISAEEAIGKSLYDLFPDIPQTRMAEKKYREVLKTGLSQTFVNEYRIEGKDYYFEICAYPSKDGISVFAKDITERKRAEQELRESEEKYRAIIETNQEWIWQISNEGIHTYSNPAIEQILGYSIKDIVGKNATIYMHPEDQREIEEMLPKWIENKKGWNNLVLRWMHKDGSIRWLESNAVGMLDVNGELIGFQGSDRDITERKLAELASKRAEEAVRKSEEKYRNLVESISDVVYAIDSSGVLTYISPVVKNILGYEPDEVVGRHFLEFVHKEDHALLMRRFSELREENVRYSDYRMIHKYGDIKWVRTLTNPIIEEGDFVGARGTLIDITERKKTEEEVIRKSKELQEKNDELTRFTYAVSHDLRSPLVTIQTFQGHLEQDLRSQDAARVEKDLGYIRNAADKMGRLLEELLRFSRVGRMMNPSEEAPLQAIVKEALDLVAGQITVRGVRVELTEEPVLLCGDRIRLVEVFQNLVGNAVKFMGDQPAPRVEIGVEQAGEELVLHVRDNGIGIDPQLQPLLFGLFHKLNPETEGEGIGLALVKRIVELHGGRIWVDSEGPGQGAIFRFTLAKTRRLPR
jgi:PAS domain S-box-containing protein